MMRLNEFEAFVHERRGVDVDLRSHRPGRVGAGLGRGGAGHALARRGPERAAGSGQRHRRHVLRPARRQGLLEGVVLRIERQDADACGLCVAHERLAGADETFLVRERNGPAGLQGGVSRQEAGGAADRGDDDIGRPLGRLADGAGAGAAPDAGSGKRRPQRFGAGIIGERSEARANRARDLCERLDVAAPDHGGDLEPVAVGAEHVDGRAADRAGGAEDRDGRHPDHPWRNCAPASKSPTSAATAQKPSRRSITPP
jgi:hypothetical protein